jgi:cytochrome b subunit of formate dehydrogenase
MQPAVSIAPMDMQKAKKQIWIYIGLGFVILIVGLLLGFAALLGAVFGIIAFRKSLVIKYKPGMYTGLTVGLLNLGLYILARTVH